MVVYVGFFSRGCYKIPLDGGVSCLLSPQQPVLPFHDLNIHEAMQGFRVLLADLVQVDGFWLTSIVLALLIFDVLLPFRLLLELRFEQLCEVGRLLQLPSSGLQFFGANVDDGRPMGRIVRIVIDAEGPDCRRKVRIGDNVINAAFPYIRIYLASIFPRLSTTKGLIITDVGSTFFLDQFDD